MKIIKYSFIMTGFISCAMDKGEPVMVGCTNDTVSVVSFSKNIVPVFNSYCTDAGCHSGINPAGSLNLTATVAYSQLMQKGKGYVDTTNPNYSVLYSEMNSTSSPMPPTGKLDACTINLVYKWIQQQAKNN